MIAWNGTKVRYSGTVLYVKFNGKFSRNALALDTVYVKYWDFMRPKMCAYEKINKSTFDVFINIMYSKCEIIYWDSCCLFSLLKEMAISFPFIKKEYNYKKSPDLKYCKIYNLIVHQQLFHITRVHIIFPSNKQKHWKYILFFFF